MSILTAENKTVQLIERVLNEIKVPGSLVLEDYMLDFCRMLKQMGVDMLEVDCGFGEHISWLLPEVDFMARIKSFSEVSTLTGFWFKYCVIDWETACSSDLVDVLNYHGVKITVEIRADELGGLSVICKPKLLQNVYCIRIVGLESVVSSDWVKYIDKIKIELGTKIDICPQNRYYSANALALEAIESQSDFLTTSLMGYGGGNGFAATEEVLMAANIVLNIKNKMDLSNLVKLGNVFELISNYKILDMKPIIGKEIFTYESGIHADGIEKNPSTYEPFDPAMVGQGRRLVVGKHSGKKALSSKLKELNIRSDFYDLDCLLELVREKSLELGRSLHDAEILDLLSLAAVAGL